jgi:putative glycerol-1-phosphate prenyltransferase
MSIIQYLSKRRPAFAVLIDPDNLRENFYKETLKQLQVSHVDLVLVGGSTLTHGYLDEVILEIKSHIHVPVVLFPGNTYQLSKEADGILFLSLISGRNPEYLIGKQVEAAPIIHETGIEVIGTGYILIEGGKHGPISYLTQTIPIPRDQHQLIAQTALAGQMIGMQAVYLESGSGARIHASARSVQEVKKACSSIVFVGGGISTPDHASTLIEAGADVIVVGTAIERHPPSMLILGKTIFDYRKQEWTRVSS